MDDPELIRDLVRAAIQGTNCLIMVALSMKGEHPHSFLLVI